jgi:hypothetical protein
VTGPEKLDVGAALSQLGADVRRTVARPAASGLRRRAERQRLVRRATGAVAVAMVVGLVSVGTVTLARGQSAPVPPTGPDPSVTAPTPTGSPTPRPRPSRPVPDWSYQPVTDPIGSTLWVRATVTLPEQQGCPSGEVTLSGWSGGAESATFPRVTVNPEDVRYGDLTGDGQPEAIIEAACWADAEASGEGEGQLLVVRRDGSRLVALGWVGPRGAVFVDRWVDDGLLHVDARPWQQDWGHRLGATLAYRWTGTAFAEAGGAPGLVPTPGGVGPAIDLRRAAGWIGCPAAVLNFDAAGAAQAAGTSWDLTQPDSSEEIPHPIDLTGRGARATLALVTCGRTASSPAGSGRGAVVLLVARPDGSYEAVDALPPPDGEITGWRWNYGTLYLRHAAAGTEDREVYFEWNGEYFQES